MTVAKLTSTWHGAHRRKKKRSGHRRIQFSAASPATPFRVDTRPALQQLALPGPRRAREGRGGATAHLTTLRLIIRCPLLAAFAAPLITTPKTRAPSLNGLFWLFYLQAAREFASLEQLDQELGAHWNAIREEFWFEHGMLLPDARADGRVPANYASFNKWRHKHIHEVPRRLDELSQRLTIVSARLAEAIRRAEEDDDAGANRDLLNPEIWDCLAVDGTVFASATDVREIEIPDGALRNHLAVHGSRAQTRDRARVGPTLTDTSAKKGAPDEGLFNIAAVWKGYDTYTRVVVGVDIAQPGEAEAPAADRLLHRIYAIVGDQFPVLLYDGALFPVHWQEYMRRYGVYCVNANAARPPRKVGGKKINELLGLRDDKPLPAGVGRRGYGTRKGEFKLTYTYNWFASTRHETPSGAHTHHLIADDGAVWEVDREPLGGRTVTKIQLLHVTGLERRIDRQGAYHFRLTLTGSCPDGVFRRGVDLDYAVPDKGGRVAWSSLIASIRIVPEAHIEKYARIHGWRNQVESFFSWLDRCFRHPSRQNSYDLADQKLDLIGAALLEDTEAWGHLAIRHPRRAAAFERHLIQVQHKSRQSVGGQGNRGDAPNDPANRQRRIA